MSERSGRSLARTALAATTLAALAACGGNRAPEAGGPATAADTVEGEVRQVGNAPFSRTVVEDDSAAVTVTGPLADELTRLTGARVRAVGAPIEGEFPGPALEVAAYEVVSVDGDEPRVGILRHRAGEGYRLETGEGEAVALRSVPAGLGSAAGGKVWVVVDEGGGVLRYGILREP